MADELTVESALKELREMFPLNPWLRIGTSAISAGDKAAIYEAEVVVTAGEYKRFSARSHDAALALTEAMAQVRSWHAEQESKR